MPPVAYSAVRFWVDCITDMSGIDFRQVQGLGVIPGQAGIQNNGARRFWIPAVAGMTDNTAPRSNLTIFGPMVRVPSLTFSGRRAP